MMSEISGTAATNRIDTKTGCELIFSEQFELQASLTGWLVANLRSEQVLLHENEIHFASQHPMRLKVVYSAEAFTGAGRINLQMS